MSDKRQDQPDGQRFITLLKIDGSVVGPYSDDFVDTHSFACVPGADDHCLTCSDEAIPVRVLQVNLEAGFALVEVSDKTEEIDITLVDDVTPGDTLLVHGGVAIARLAEVSDDQ